MDLLSDLKQFIERELAVRGYTAKPSDDLDAVLLRYLNVLNRVPRHVPWDVKLSKELSAKTQDSRIQKGIKRFIQKAKAGEDLTPYLSRRFPQNPDYQDSMFYDWGMFHFHLGTKRNPRGLITAIGEIL